MHCLKIREEHVVSGPNNKRRVVIDIKLIRFKMKDSLAKTTGIYLSIKLIYIYIKCIYKDVFKEQNNSNVYASNTKPRLF